MVLHLMLLAASSRGDAKLPKLTNPPRHSRHQTTACKVCNYTKNLVLLTLYHLMKFLFTRAVQTQKYHNRTSAVGFGDGAAVERGLTAFICHVYKCLICNE
jgi:hypothetical protein